MNVITLNKKYQGTCNLNVTVENYTKTFTVTTECKGTAYCTPSINSSSLTYDGYSKNLVSSTSTYGISNYYLGYKKGSQATSDGQITWTSANPTGGKLTATEAGTYYIYKKYTVNSNYYCGSNMTYTQVGTKTISQGPPIIETNGWVNNSTNSGYVEYNPMDSESVKLKVKNNSGTVTWPSSVTAKIGSTTTSWQCFSGGIVYIPAGTSGGTYDVTAIVSVGASSDGNRTSGTKSLTWSVPISPRTMDVIICGVLPEDIQNKTINYSVKYPNEAALFIETGFCSPTLYAGSYPPTQQTLYYIGNIPSNDVVTYMSRSEIGTDTFYICLIPDNINNWDLLPGYPNSDAIQVNLTVTKGDNPMTCTISRGTIYSANYTTATIHVYDPQGTITASLDTNSYVTISTYNSYSKTFTVTYKATGGPTTITITDAGNGNYNSITRQVSVTCVTDEEYSTQYKDQTCTTQGYNITSYGTPTVTIGNLSAGTSSTTVSCSVTNSSSWYQKWKSGYVSQHSGSPTGTVTWSITTQTFTSVGGSTSTITRFSKSSNTLSHSTMGTNLGTDYVKITAVNSGDSSKTATAEKSITNYVTSITPKSSSNDDTTHFSYANIGAGATSASPTLSGGGLYTFTSGSTVFDSSGSPSFGGSASYTRTYTLSASQNGFTAVNASTGVLTATNRGTTPGAARSSGTVTGDLVITYTHPSSLGSGKVISSTKTSTATCTQNANALTGITFTVNNQTISYNGNTTGTVTASYTSGSTKNVSNDANTSYVDNSDPDIVSFTKNS